MVTVPLLGLGMRPWAQDTADAADDAHHVRGGDHHIEAKPVFGLDLVDHFLAADDIRARGLGFLDLVALGDHQHAHGAAGAVRQNHRATDLLVGMAGVNAQANGNLDGFVKLGLAGLAGQLAGLGGVVGVEMVDQLRAVHNFFPCFMLLSFLWC